MKVIKAIYNFLVGDMIILVGVLITMALLALLSYVPALRVASGALLVVAVLVILLSTLSRETRPKH